MYEFNLHPLAAGGAMSISRRSFVKGVAATVGAASMGVLPGQATGGVNPMNGEPKAGTGGEIYVPYAQRRGDESDVWFTRDLSAEGLRKIFAKVGGALKGQVAIKLHTGDKNGPNIIPRPWVQQLIARDLPKASIVETNAYYEGDRYTTPLHRETLKVNGWTFAPVDILDEHGTAKL
ncbi:MAG: twin-arginine translocation signal domain-containing protein, partial [Desulfovibrionaceae bacterium]|nr:twin-arginine translocation signal domain-containing protein [Desulfovibrionaceae bacterium]